jgi:hypothetical protein
MTPLAANPVAAFGTEVVVEEPEPDPDPEPEVFVGALPAPEVETWFERAVI